MCACTTSVDNPKQRGTLCVTLKLGHDAALVPHRDVLHYHICNVYKEEYMIHAVALIIIRWIALEYKVKCKKEENMQTSITVCVCVCE